MAFLFKGERRGQVVWRLCWTDATRGTGTAGRRYVDCITGKHSAALEAAALPRQERVALANGATSAPLRKLLLRCYEALEAERRQDRVRLGGRGPRFDTPLSDLVQDYCALIDYRQAVSAGEHAQAPPDPGWRPHRREARLTVKAAYDLRTTAEWFQRWLPAGLTSGEVDADTVAHFIDAIARGQFTPDDVRRRSHRTLNKHRSNLRGFFNTFKTSAYRQLFRISVAEIFEEVEAFLEPAQKIVVYEARTITGFLKAAEHYADPARVVSIRRHRRGRLEVFQQHANPQAPVIELTLLLACTGMRLSEALSLKWEDCNLETGLLTIHSAKTQRDRHLPLARDPAGDVAPRFLDLLRAWRRTAPATEFVLPVNGGTRPSFPKGAWKAVARMAKAERFGPQGLRRSFESTLAVIGFPAGLSAFWLGHSLQVAERHYLAFAPGRLKGHTVEAVMGLEVFIERALERTGERLSLRLVQDGRA